MITKTPVARTVRFDKALFACSLAVGLVAGGLFVVLGLALDLLASSGQGDWGGRFATGFICGFVASLLGLLTDCEGGN